LNENHEKNNFAESEVAASYLQKREIANESQKISRNDIENILGELREQNKWFCWFFRFLNPLLENRWHACKKLRAV
jgi:hypothetical protein